jgi:hypothetical protein
VFHPGRRQVYGNLFVPTVGFGSRSRNHGLITGWRILGILSIPMEEMVGTWGLEPQTSARKSSELRCSCRYCSFASSALACFRMGMSGSASEPQHESRKLQIKGVNFSRADIAD